MVRIVENHDWVIFTLLGLGVVYLILFNWIQKEVSFKEYLLQPYGEAQNNVLSWIFVSGVFIVSQALLLAQYIPIVPRYVTDIDISGWVLNKIGFMIIVLSIYYLLRTLLTLLFYRAIAQPKKWLILGFLAQRFYFIESLIIMMAVIAHYYLGVDREQAYIVYAIAGMVFFVIKNICYFLHKGKPLPREWYYKILYICALQILPMLAVWKFVFL